MSDSIRNSQKHIKLFIPGPTEVRPEILEAQTQWMCGHRMPECVDLIKSIEPKLKQVFFTEQTVLLFASSGTGIWEGAIRNCADKKVLNCVNGAFSSRWADVTTANGKENTVISKEWGQPILPEEVAKALAEDEYDAITVVHNETSVGVENPIQEIAQAVRESANGSEIMILVDSVSGLSGARLEFDAWDLDVALASSQKAFALPPGLAVCAVSDRALAKAKTVKNRGYYFDFLTMLKKMKQHQTPATPAISLLWALNVQLDAMMEETMEGRFSRHIAMRDRTIEWAKGHGIELFAEDEAYTSPTVSCFKNNLDLDIKALNNYLRERGMILSNGYGSLKGKAFRIAHMGDLQMEDMEELFTAVDGFLAENK